MNGKDATPAKFSYAPTAPAPASGAARELGLGALASQLGASDDYLAGHWCSRCQGIWYGLLLEVQCPVCGNRSG